VDAFTEHGLVEQEKSENLIVVGIFAHLVLAVVNVWDKLD